MSTQAKCPECRDTGATWTHDGQVDACWRCTVLAEVEWQTYGAATAQRSTLRLKEAA